MRRAGHVAFAPSAPLDPPVTREDIEGALEQFARYVTASHRRAFWRTENGKQKWIIQPEKQAQTLLELFLQARLADRVEVFREIAAGGGRVDIYVLGRSGLAVIIELKMTGPSYPTKYAFAGTEQITHYMDAKNVRLGYLVLFDARGEKKFGTTPDASTVPPPNTVRSMIVDVRRRSR